VTPVSARTEPGPDAALEFAQAEPSPHVERQEEYPSSIPPSANMFAHALTSQNELALSTEQPNLNGLSRSPDKLSTDVVEAAGRPTTSGEVYEHAITTRPPAPSGPLVDSPSEKTSIAADQPGLGHQSTRHREPRSQNIMSVSAHSGDELDSRPPTIPSAAAVAATGSTAP